MLFAHGKNFFSTIFCYVLCLLNRKSERKSITFLFLFLNIYLLANLQKENTLNYTHKHKRNKYFIKTKHKQDRYD